MNLTKNFTLAEFTRSQTALRRGISNEPNTEHLASMIALCKHIMQPIRDGLGAVIITSGYRSINFSQSRSDQDRQVTRRTL